MCPAIVTRHNKCLGRYIMEKLASGWDNLETVDSGGGDADVSPRRPLEFNTDGKSNTTLFPEVGPV